MRNLILLVILLFIGIEAMGSAPNDILPDVQDVVAQPDNDSLSKGNSIVVEAVVEEDTTVSAETQKMNNASDTNNSKKGEDIILPDQEIVPLEKEKPPQDKNKSLDLIIGEKSENIAGEERTGKNPEDEEILEQSNAVSDESNNPVSKTLKDSGVRPSLNEQNNKTETLSIDTLNKNSLMRKSVSDKEGQLTELEPKASEKYELPPNESEGLKYSFFQENKWQISAISIAVLSSLMISMESQAYNKLAERNKELENLLESSILTDEVLQIRTEFNKNKSAMVTHKANVNNFTGLVLLSLVWEGYLAYFSSNSDEINEIVDSSSRRRFYLDIQPDFDQRLSIAKISLVWDW